MAAWLMALRDVVVVIALGWIGVTLKPGAPPAREHPSQEQCTGGGATACTQRTAPMSSVDCPYP